MGRGVTLASAGGNFVTRCWVKKKRIPALASLDAATSRKRSRSSRIASVSGSCTPRVITSSATNGARGCSRPCVAFMIVGSTMGATRDAIERSGVGRTSVGTVSRT